jgi:DNA-directed RNA polymerase sigma subunit (sigma70/sigma32)
MTGKGSTWDRRRSEQLRSTLTESDIEALKTRAESDPSSLSIDEVGVLFLVTRDRIRAIEEKARREKRGGSGE